MDTFVALPLLALILLFVWIKFRFSYWERRKIPHLKPSLLTGNLRMTHWSREYDAAYYKFKGTGPFAGFYHFHTKTALILEPELVKNVFIKDFGNFDSRGVFHNERDDPLTGNIFAVDGPRWRQLRLKVTPAFTSNKMKLMSGIINSVSHKLVDFMSEKTKNGAIDLNVFETFGCFTADVIGSCAFGLECNSLTSPSAEFVVMGRKAFYEPRHNAIIDGLINSFPNAARFLRMRTVNQSVHDFYMDITKSTVAHRKTTKEKRNDLMDSLIEVCQSKESNDEGLTINEIAAQAFAFMVAGFETSSTTLSFTAYELAQNQHVQDKLRAHIKEVLGRHNNEMTYECMKEMQYLDMVINETLRKDPPVPQLFRKTLKRYETSDPKYYIEPGTLVSVPVQAIHHDPEFYPQPEKFIPERFLPEEAQKRPQGTYLPFGEGPRNCVGYRFAKMQVKYALVYLISNFRFSVSPQTVIPYKPVERNILTAPENGITLRCERVK